MTATGRYAAPDNSFTRSAATAAVKGAALIVVAIVIGVLLLLVGFDSGDTTATIDDGPDESATATEPEETTTTVTTGDLYPTVTAETTSTTTTTAPVVVDPPNEVKVAVLNGRGESGLAGRRSDQLKTAGYVTTAANANTSDKEVSLVYYMPGYADEAALVAVALNGSPSLVAEAPPDPLALVAESYREATTDYHIYVVLGSDETLG